MSRSEFRWNKKRKHYAYLFKDLGDYRRNILLHSDPSIKVGWNEIKQRHFCKNYIKLYRHPNPNKTPYKTYYVEKRICVDHKDSFDAIIYKKWRWNKNDKRKIKRLKKRTQNSLIKAVICVHFQHLNTICL